VLRVSIWTPNRIGVFLVICNMLIPFRINLTFITSVRFSISYVIYAALWGYIPGPLPPMYNIEGPLIINGYYFGFMFPFYAPGLVIAWFVWRTSSDSNMTKRNYYERIISLQLFHTLIVWYLFPCPISFSLVLCLPTAITGILALPFASKVVKEVDSLWDDSETNMLVKTEEQRMRSANRI
jgi:hypothetical protein